MENWHEHIDDYINGTLGGDLLAAFEKEMEVNASLKAAVDNYDDAKKISEGLLEVDMMETISRLEAKNEKKQIDSEKVVSVDEKIEPKVKTARVFNLRTIMSVAATVGILLFAGWWMFGPTGNSYDMDKILVEYIKPVNEDSTKSVDTVGMSPFEKGMWLFKTNQFEESEKWLKIHLSETEDKKMRSKGHFWLGAAHLLQSEVEEALEAWKKSEEEDAKKNLEIVENGRKK